MAINNPLTGVLFLDTAFVIALSSRGDRYHSVAVELSRLISIRRPKIVTSRGVLLEIGNSLSKFANRASAAAIVQSIDNDARIEVVDVTRDIFAVALRLFTERPDKEWGLTDCLSFRIMQAHGIFQALTTDEHFVQAGYMPVMK